MCAVGGTGQLDQIISSQRDATFIGADMLAEDFVHATFSDGTFAPKRPSRRLGAGISYRDSNSPPQFAARLPAA